MSRLITRRWLIDTAERATMTAAQTGIGVFVANSTADLGVDFWRGVLVAAIASGLAVVKAAIAAQLDAKGTASLAPGV